MPKQVVVFLILLFSAGYLESNSHANTSFDIRFGIVEETHGGHMDVVRETLIIPRRYASSGFHYGITIFPPNNDPFEIYLVARFPAAPKKISGVAKTSAKETHGKVIKSPSQRGQGVSTIPFWFDPGDPTGEYSLEVYINKTKIKTIRYKVVDSSDSAN
jgi:hypothetical protein